jgi:hypothetical protein
MLKLKNGMAYRLINFIKPWRSDDQYYQIIQKAYLVNMASDERGFVYVKIGDNSNLYDKMFFTTRDIIAHSCSKLLTEYDPLKEFLILFQFPDGLSEIASVSFEAITDIR